MTYRIQRFSSTLKHCLGDILLNELNNPEFHLISISEVVVSKDLRQAKVYVSSLNDNPEDLLKKLDKASGFIKKLLPKKMNLKYIPEITFIEDSGFLLDQKILKLHQT